MPSFYDGKRFFLTYPQCDKSKEQLLTFLRTKGTIREYVICEEHHADGSPHLHACVAFEEHIRKPVHYLDFENKHPNKQDPRNWAACKVYCRKEGNFIEENAQELDRAVKRIDLALEVTKYERKIDWLSYCVSSKIGYQYAIAAWSYVHSTVSTVLSDVHDGRMCEALLQFKFNEDLHKCLVLVGPSGCGKTTWAKTNMPKPALFVSHHDSLKGFEPGYHVSIIFDDVSYGHCPRDAQIAVTDFHDDRDIHCRHTTAFIPAGTFKCFTANVPPLLYSDEAIRRRIQVYNVNV